MGLEPQTTTRVSVVCLSDFTRVETNNNNINSADVIDEFSYDSRGRTIAKTTHVIGSSVPAYVSYRYDNLGNTTDIIYPENTPLVITEIHVNSLQLELMVQVLGKSTQVSPV